MTLKRLFDIMLAFVAAILLTIPFVIVALMVRFTSKGPILYWSQRVGKNNQLFLMPKFRSMWFDTPAVATHLLKNPERLLTPIGSFLRKSSLDELPQLWNVFRGDMSLVGPRPERPHFVEKFKEDIGRYMWRHMYKPGMTGWAQVNGLRGNTSIEDRIKYDLYYLENWSLSLDFKVLLRTLVARKNAY